jgi:hypothetical protein
VPAGTLADGGLTAIDTNCASVTVSWVDAEIDPDVALIFALPFATLEARPAFTVATEFLSLFQVAVDVRSLVLPSVYVPVALNCWVVPSAIDGFCGARAIDASVAWVTVSVLLPDIEPDVAVMCAVPVATLVANPWLVATLLIVATAGESELHCTVVVMSCVLLSVNVPVAANCCVVPSGMEGIAGVTAIETRAAGVTVRVVDPLTVADVAVTDVFPTPTADATPWPFTVAMAVLVVFQVAVCVKSCVLPSEYVPVAFSAWVVPTAKEGLAGVTAIEVNNAGVTVRFVDPEIVPEVAEIDVLPATFPVASPPVEIVAVPVVEEFQVTLLVRFCVLPSEYVPVAVYCCVAPTVIEAFPGVTASDIRVALAPVPLKDTI